MKKLLRNSKDGWAGGVCQGIAEWTDTDPIIWRLLAIWAGASLPYLVLWLLLDDKKEKH